MMRRESIQSQIIATPFAALREPPFLSDWAINAGPGGHRGPSRRDHVGDADAAHRPDPVVLDGTRSDPTGLLIYVESMRARARVPMLNQAWSATSPRGHRAPVALDARRPCGRQRRFRRKLRVPNVHSSDLNVHPAQPPRARRQYRVKPTRRCARLRFHPLQQRSGMGWGGGGRPSRAGTRASL